MSPISLLPLVILVLLGLGGLAAVVYAIVYAAVNKRPGIALAAVLVPVAVVACVGVIAAIFFPVVMHQAPAVQHEWTADKTLTIDVNGPRVGLVDDPPAPLRWIAVAILALVGISLLMWKRAHPHGEHRGGWGWAVPLVLVALAGIYFMRARHVSTPVDVTSSPAQTMAATEPQTTQEWQSIQGMWERMNQPRIPLEPEPHRANSAAASTNALAVATASSDGKAKVEENEDGNELADKAERIARMARLLAVVANQVSDVASAVGRGFVGSEGQEEPVEAVLSETVEQVEPAENNEPAESTPTEPRPAWVDHRPTRVGNTWREVVATEQYATPEECYRAADALLLFKTYEHIQLLTGVPEYDLTTPMQFNVDNLSVGQISRDGRMVLSDHWRNATDHRVRQLYSAGITVDFIRRQIAKKAYLETVEGTFAPMHTLYTQIEFTPTVDAELRRMWDAYRRQERLMVVGIGAGSVLSLVALLFGLLKVDTWTKGYYTKRLFLGVPGAIIGLVALLVALS